MKSAPGIITHIRAGVFYSTVASAIQGLVEAVILAFSYSGYILMPIDVFKINLFIVLRKVLGLGTGESIPFMPDRYLGPGFMDKIPFIFNVVTVYALLGLLGGVFLGIFIGIAFKFLRKPLDYKELSLFYLVLVLSLLVSLNVIFWLNNREIVEISSSLGLVSSFCLIAGAAFVAFFIHRLVAGKPFPGKHKASSSDFVAKSRIAVISVVFMACLALILNVLIFRDKGYSGILSATMNNMSPKGLANLRDKNINVILISIDSLRADHLGSYGYSRKTSPNIDSLASDGVLLSSAFSTTSWTLPSHISMLTSMYSEAHGVISEYDYLDESRITLAEILKESGYATAAFVSGPYVHSRYGYSQGFDVYDDSIIDQAAQAGRDLVQEITTPQLNKSIQSWLSKNHQKKFFLFLHYFDVHFDYIPPPPYDTMFDPDYEGTIDARNFYHNARINQDMSPRDLEHVIALYDGEIAFTDKYIGELLASLKELGIYDNSIIILTADHGDEFFEHGFKGHKRTLYDEVLRVPLVFKFPSDSNLTTNKEVQGIASIVDIGPTVLDYLGIEAEKEMQGQTLLPLMSGGERQRDFLVYARHEYKLVASRSASSKFIHSVGLAKKEFYDLVSDPGEQVNLFDENKKVTEGNESLVSLVNWLNAQSEFHVSLPKSDIEKKVELSDSAKEQLKALGYLQ